jgi:hypothetical protein
MLAEIVDTFPQLRFTVGVEDLRGGRGRLGSVRRTEEQPASPRTVLNPSHFDPDSNRPAFVTERREVVNHWFCWIAQI